MKYLIILIMSLGISCKSTTDMQSKTPKDNNKYLLALSKEKTIDNDKEKITTYKNIPFKKVLSIKNGDFKFSFKNEILFEGSKECLFLLEIFNDETLLISTSKTLDNKYAAGPENFKRGKILLIDKETGNTKVADLEEDIFLKSHKESLNRASNIENVFVINDISYDNNVMKLEDSSGRYREITLTEIETMPLKCN